MDYWKEAIYLDMPWAKARRIMCFCTLPSGPGGKIRYLRPRAFRVRVVQQAEWPPAFFIVFFAFSLPELQFYGVFLQPPIGSRW